MAVFAYGRALRLAVIVSGAVLFGLPLRASAAADVAAKNLQDVTCLALAFHMASSTLPQVHEAGSAMAMYYLGRLDGRTPHFDYLDSVAAATRRMTAMSFRTDATRCGRELQSRGHFLQQLASTLAHRKR